MLKVYKHPTDINMKIFEPDDLSFMLKEQFKVRKTRRKYARIQFTHTGVLTPTSERPNNIFRYQVPIIMTLEPLHLGVLPNSVIPVLIAIFMAIISGLPLAFKLDSYLQSVALSVREDEKLCSTCDYLSACHKS